VSDGAASSLPEAERLARLRLARTPRVGPITFHRLLERFGSAEMAVESLPGLARRAGAPPVVVPSATAVQRERDALRRLGGCLLVYGDPAYPAALRGLEDAPPVLACRGDLSLLQRDAVAIVGARNASANGCLLAENFARALGAAGFPVVSGLARGIDGAAHRGAMETGTVAVMAGGLDRIYPREHEGLAQEVAEKGVLIAEMSLGTEPQAALFPRRNRVVSGLSRGTVVIEAALRSGSLITARFALEQGREVMAVPGSPLDPRARGCNRLIKEGAHLVEEAADLLDLLGAPGPSVPRAPLRTLTRGVPPPSPEPVREPAEAPVTAVEQILALLSPEAQSVDEVIRRCQLSAAVVGQILLELELAGRVERHPGNRISLLAANSQ